MRSLVESTPNVATPMGRDVLRRAGSFVLLRSPYGLRPLAFRGANGNGNGR
jgi:hypothetical protein